MRFRLTTLIFRVEVLAPDEPWAEPDDVVTARTQKLLPAVVPRCVDALCSLPGPDPGQSAAGER